MNTINFFALLIVVQIVCILHTIGHYAYITTQHRTIIAKVMTDVQYSAEKSKDIMINDNKATFQYYSNKILRLDDIENIKKSNELHQRWYGYWDLPDFHLHLEDSLPQYQEIMKPLLPKYGSTKGNPDPILAWQPKRYVSNNSPYAALQKSIWQLQTLTQSNIMYIYLYPYGCDLTLYNKIKAHVALSQKSALQNDIIHAKIGLPAILHKNAFSYVINNQFLPITADGSGFYKTLCTDTGTYQLTGYYIPSRDTTTCKKRYSFTLNYRVVEPCH